MSDSQIATGYGVPVTSSDLEASFETFIQDTLTDAGVLWFAQIELVGKAMVEDHIGDTVDWADPPVLIKQAFLQIVIEYFILTLDYQSSNLDRYTAGDVSLSFAKSLRMPMSWQDLLASTAGIGYTGAARGSGLRSIDNVSALLAFPNVHRL